MTLITAYVCRSLLVSEDLQIIQGTEAKARLATGILS